MVDATLQEEACSLASLLVSVTSEGVVTCVRKVGKGSLDPESIFEMMEVRWTVTLGDLPQLHAGEQAVTWPGSGAREQGAGTANACPLQTPGCCISVRALEVTSCSQVTGCHDLVGS